MDKLNDETLNSGKNIQLWIVPIKLTDLRPSTLNACWKAVWPKCVKSRDSVIPNTTEFPNIITLAHTIGGEGFDDLSFVDIAEWLVDKPLSEEEIIEVVLETPNPKEHSDNDEEDHILNAELIQEGLELASKLGNFHVIYCILTTFFRSGTYLPFFHRYNVFFRIY